MTKKKDEELYSMAKIAAESKDQTLKKLKQQDREVGREISSAITLGMLLAIVERVAEDHPDVEKQLGDIVTDLEKDIGRTH